ncbi:MAG: transporter substrate-binding domain-containing protein, partial [Bacillota bacterium]|nr:transporter substrate-binding domain-containing protein [Bacillota bacterium]
MKKIIYIISFIMIILILFLSAEETNKIGASTIIDYSEEQTKFIEDNKDKVFSVAIEGTENITTFKSEDCYGLNYHLLDLLKEELGFSFEVIPQPDIPTFLKSIELQLYDIYLGPNKSEEREKTVSFMPIMFSEPYHVYVNLEHQRVSNLLEIGEHRIGVVENDYIIPIILKKYNIKRSNLNFYKTRDNLIKAIENSEVDIVISAIDISDKLENAKESFELGAEKTALSRISVNKKNPILSEVINVAVKRIINNTNLNKIKDEVTKEYIIIEFLNNLNNQEKEYLNKIDVINIPFVSDINVLKNILDDFSKTIKIPIKIQNKSFESNNYLYSDKVVTQQLIALSTDGNINISNIHGLESYKLGTYKESSIHKLRIENKFFNKIKIYSDFEKMMEALLEGDIDLLIMDDYDYAKYLSTQNDDSLYIVGKDLYEIGIKIPFNNSDVMMVNIFNKYLRCYGNLEEIALSEKRENLKIHQAKKDLKIIFYTTFIVISIIILFTLIFYYIKKLKLNLFNEKAYRKKLIYDDATGLFNVKGISEQIKKYCDKEVSYTIIAYDFHFMKKSEDIYDGIIAKEIYSYLSKKFKE